MAAASNMRCPPAFNEKDMDYEQWKKDLELWCLLTDLPQKKQAIAVHLSLTGRARQATSEITVDDMRSDNGMTVLKEKLDRVFLQDKNCRCFNNYLAFENYRRAENVSIDEFLSEFDRRHFKLKECGVTLPDAIVACRLIKSCNLSDVHFQLALSTTTKMTFDEVRATLKRLFSEYGNKILCPSTEASSIESDTQRVKVEPVFEAEAFYNGSNTRGRSNLGYTRRFGSSKRRVPRERRGINPRGADGRISLCNVCGSRMHWMRSCPHKESYSGDQSFSVENEDEIHITLMAESVSKDKIDVLLGESLGHIILDSGCSKTVCGQQWFQCYLEMLSESEKSQVTYRESSSIFRFGDGKRLKSMKCAVIPCILAGKKIQICTDIVECNVPLLLSKESMKKAGMSIDLKNDTVTVFEKCLKLDTTTLGHYKLPIYPSSTTERVDEVLINTASWSSDKIALKLHRQFAHPASEKLQKLLKESGRNDAELLNAVQRVTDTCTTCLRFRKPRARPVVAMPLATSFNEVLAMDIKTFQGVYILVMVDLATRYCKAMVVENKTASTIVSALFTSWITSFGAPQQFLSDNGGEFNNEEVRALGDLYGIRILTTAAESPWSNGVCERLNCILGISVERIVDDLKCSVNIALSWAVAARNSLHNYNGFSPNQLVFGYNPVVPDVINASPSTLETRTNSEMVAANINAMHSARREFVKNESNEKIRRALLNQVRPNKEEDIANGDIVYFKRINNNCWQGPGVVIGRDGKQILVKHGGSYVRVHECRLQRGLSSDLNTEEIRADGRLASHCGDSKILKPVEENNEKEQISDPGLDYHSDLEPVSDENTTAEAEVDEYIYPHRNMVNPKIGQRIEFIDQEGERNVAQVVSRAGKAGGLYGHAFNIKYSSGRTEWIDLSRNVEKWRVVPDSAEVLLAYDSDEIAAAKNSEYENWKKNEVFDEVNDHGQSNISLKWVITEKIKENTPFVKARLVARGFEEKLDQGHRTDSPTCLKDSLRIIFALIVAFGWTINSIDIKAAFLQGNEITRDVFVKPPPEFRSNKLWKLKKNVYGLNDAARAWYLKVKDVLYSLNMHKCSVDPAIFYWHFNGSLSGIVCIHVDDIVWAGVKEFSAVIDILKRKFLVGTCSNSSFKYVGINVIQRKDCLHLHQLDYIESLEEIKISLDRASKRSNDLNKCEINELRMLIGQFNWIAGQTRPDISFDACVLSTLISSAKIEDLLTANKLIKKVKRNRVILCYPALRDLCQLTLECYSDASFGNLRDGGSQGGYVIFLVDSGGKRCLMSWQSKRIRRVVKSTLAAETLALLDAAEAGIYISHIISEILAVGANAPIVKCFVDNKSLVESVHSTRAIEDKQLRIDIAVLRNLLETGELHDVYWVQAAHQLANALTKRGACAASLVSADCSAE